MSHFCSGDHSQHPVYHAKSCSQDWNNSQLFAAELFYCSLADRRFNLNVPQFQIPCGFVAHVHCYLTDQCPEVSGACLNSSDQSDLMLDQRVIHNYNFLHFYPPFFVPTLLKAVPVHLIAQQVL